MAAARRAVRRTAVTAVAITLLAGCAADSSGSADPTPSEDPIVATSPAPPPEPSAPVPVASTVEADCPYLEVGLVQDTVGQKTPTVLVTTTEPAIGPLPTCEFRKPNDEPAALVETATASTTNEAQQLALGFAPGGNPVAAGDGGSVLVKKGEAQTVLGAWRGMTVVYVTINQESSLEAVELAKQVFSAIP